MGLRTVRLLVPVAVALCFSVGCAGRGARPLPFPQPSPPLGPSPQTSPRAAAVVETALGLQGVPYRPGGTDPAGFDCSGLVAYVLARHGVLLPRTVAEQFTVGRKVHPAAIQAGDLVFFRTSGRGASHVGIAVTPEAFVHAPSSAGTVRVEQLWAPYWSRRFLGARRLP